MAEGSPTPFSYPLIRLLINLMLNVFYRSIVVENAELIPKNGRPCIVCANHGNSLVDAGILVKVIPSNIRNMIRLTAKSTLFGHGTFTSWLVASTGAVPIQRRKDFADGRTDNSHVMEGLLSTLELGDAICLFPEGVSRYHPAIAPFKTGVARILSDVLTRNRHNPVFEVLVLPVSITYMHREYFRSDVLITFNSPMSFRVKDHSDFLAPADKVQAVTTQMYQEISSNTIDAPSWNMVASAKLASQLYAPLSTRRKLGNYVRVTRKFVEAFKASESSGEKEDEEITRIRRDLMTYKNQLLHLGINDDAVRHILSHKSMLSRACFCLASSIILFSISIPGLLLWLPVFATTLYEERRLKKSGPKWDTWDDIAQTKIITGFLSGSGVWLACSLLTFQFSPLTFILIPLLMWMTLRCTEDAFSSSYTLIVLMHVLRTDDRTLVRLRSTREELRVRIMCFAVETLGLPKDPEKGSLGKGHVKSCWESVVRYFSISGSRKRHWDETRYFHWKW